MSSLKTILVVDDSAVSRKVLSQMLSAEYAILEAENGQAALELLIRENDTISAVILDLVMPVMDGYTVLEILEKGPWRDKLPVIVVTDSGSSSNEQKALALGAWDFISKPFDARIVTLRLKNIIARSQLPALKELKYLAEYDVLTGIYNKRRFFDATAKMLKANPHEKFAFLRFDVDRFQLINSFFGTAEGDRLMIYIAQEMAKELSAFPLSSYGRIESDIVAMCLPYDQARIEQMAHQSKRTLSLFNLNYDIVPSIGIYVIGDPNLPVEEMYNRATLAAKTCKGNYVDFYAYYTESMSAALNKEQEITNEMNFALRQGQFIIYIQPKYNIHTNLPCGGEALVRWLHPTKGLISPGEFIPIFERNGFISKLDYFVWEATCKCLQGWIQQGLTPYPISVNVSRVNIYNPNLVETLLELVNRYQLEPALLSLELTESAYTDNPTTMKKTMAQLQGHGFSILMDDFGSGYSSLALLKDIMIDVLKIDMRFLSASDLPGRGENIIASVIRMAKWLNIPVIAEGAETQEQVSFLRSVGCDYVQGYYYARPMPPQEYEQLCTSLSLDLQLRTDKKYPGFCYDNLFSLNDEMQRLFSNNLQAAVLCEFFDDRVELIRVNEAYYALLGHENLVTRSADMLGALESASRAPFLHAFQSCVQSTEPVDCEYMRRRANGSPLWIGATLRYVTTVDNKHIIIGELTDITMRKELDAELQKYKSSLRALEHGAHTVLIASTEASIRTALKEILEPQFRCLEAESSYTALKALQEVPNEVTLILLDMDASPPETDAFLRQKQKLPALDCLPIIMVLAYDNPEQQANAVALGASDYLIKPFVPALVLRRVSSVLESSRRFREMVREYNTMSAQIKTDLMTGLLNRVSAEKAISLRLAGSTGSSLMIMLDIDSFKKINDVYGHDYGDQVLCAVAEKLQLHFEPEDLIARMGGDEFSVFVSNISDMGLVEQKAHQLCQSISQIVIDGKNAHVTCSLGLALSSPEANSFPALYQNADKALYSAKSRGRNIISIYGEETANTSIARWINNAESVLDALKDCVYLCDQSSYALLYANDGLCKLMGVTREGCKGKKCYEVLMHRTSPCDFCSMQDMIIGKVYTRLFRAPTTSRLFLMRGENIDKNGTVAHLEVAIDITDTEHVGLPWSSVSGYGEG